MILQLLTNAIIAASIYALIALGFSVIYRTVRFFHFAHGVVYTGGAYFGYTFAIQLGMPLLAAFFFASVLAGGLGIAIDRIVYFPLRKRKAPNLVYLIASFGVFIFLQNTFQLLYGAQILSVRTGPVKVGREFLGAIITDTQILIIAAAAILTALLSVYLKWTRLGKEMRAVSDDPLAARVCGINPEKTITLAFGIGSFLAGAAGFLIAFETNIEPTMGMNAILKGITASIVGGIGSIPGAVFGGLFVGLAENLGVWKIPTGWKDCIAFSILILFLLIRPGGILGTRAEGERL